VEFACAHVRACFREKFSRVDERGSLIDSRGNPSRFLFGIGPVRKAALWETTTVSEIRQQAPDLAEHLLRYFEGSGRHPNSFRIAV
jgi:hypothetical protein